MKDFFLCKLVTKLMQNGHYAWQKAIERKWPTFLWHFFFFCFVNFFEKKLGRMYQQKFDSFVKLKNPKWKQFSIPFKFHSCLKVVYDYYVARSCLNATGKSLSKSCYSKDNPKAFVQLENIIIFMNKKTKINIYKF